MKYSQATHGRVFVIRLEDGDILNDATVTGCVRSGVRVWHVMEVILYELLDSPAQRVYDKDTGFNLLKP